MNALEIFGLLVVGHALADYPLQGDFLSKAKNRVNPIPGVPWYQAMGSHCVIHAGFVWLITGSALIGVFELMMHWIIDDRKCADTLTYNEDQILHLLCKVVWTLLVVVGVSAHG